MFEHGLDAGAIVAVIAAASLHAVNVHAAQNLSEQGDLPQRKLKGKYVSHVLKGLLFDSLFSHTSKSASLSAYRYFKGIKPKQLSIMREGTQQA